MEASKAREPFAKWLLVQANRADAIGQFAAAARADGRFPQSGSPNDVRLHIAMMQMTGDFLDVVDNAELEWLSDSS